MLSSLPFSIKNPSLSLVETFSKILPKFASDDTVHFALAHLVERTCANAGYAGNEKRNTDQCAHISNGWAKVYSNKLRGAKSKKEKMLAIGFLANLKSILAMQLLQPLAQGAMTHSSECSLQAAAIRASFWGSVKSQTTTEFFLPIFLNVTNCRDARMAALDQLFIPNNIEVTTLSMIVTQMSVERDIQIMNYVFSVFEKYSRSSFNCSGCGGDKLRRVRYFLKYMKKIRLHTTDYGLHISQTYRHEHYDNKDARGGGHEVWLIGGDNSFLPAEIRLRLDSNQFGGYQTNLLEIRLRTQGVSEALSELFYKRDKDVWNTDQLEEVLRKMGILLKQKPTVEIEIEIKVKDVLVYQKILTKDMFLNPRKDIISSYADRLQNTDGQNKFHWLSLFSWGTQVKRFCHFIIIFLKISVRFMISRLSPVFPCSSHPTRPPLP